MQERFRVLQQGSFVIGSCIWIEIYPICTMNGCATISLPFMTNKSVPWWNTKKTKGYLSIMWIILPLSTSVYSEDSYKNVHSLKFQCFKTGLIFVMDEPNYWENLVCAILYFRVQISILSSENPDYLPLRPFIII